MSPEVVCLGEVLVDFISTEVGVSIEESPGFIKAQGGAMANVAADLARLGIKAGFIGKVGNDEFGRFLAKSLRDMKVDTSGLYFSEDYDTGLVFVALDNARKPSFCFVGKPSADMMLEPDEVKPGFFKGAKFLHAATVSIVEEPARSATFRAVELARAQGCRVSFDPNFRLHLWEDHDLLKSLTRDLVRQSHLVKLSMEEAVFLLGDTEPDAACESLLFMGPDAAVVTLGEEGAVYATSEGRSEAPGFKVDAVDTTGAGDAFMAGLLARLVSSDSWPPGMEELGEAVGFANAAAALSTLKPGAVSAMPSRTEVLKFIEKHG